MTRIIDGRDDCRRCDGSGVWTPRGHYAGPPEVCECVPEDDGEQPIVWVSVQEALGEWVEPSTWEGDDNDMWAEVQIRGASYSLLVGAAESIEDHERGWVTVEAGPYSLRCEVASPNEANAVVLGMVEALSSVLASGTKP